MMPSSGNSWERTMADKRQIAVPASFANRPTIMDETVQKRVPADEKPYDSPEKSIIEFRGVVEKLVSRERIPPKKRRVQLLTTEYIYGRLKDRSVEYGISVNELVNRILDLYLS